MEDSISSTIFEEFLESIAEKYPKIILRKDIGYATEGILHPRTQANCDSLGTGIPIKFRIGKHTAYPTCAVISYLRKKFRDSNRL